MLSERDRQVLTQLEIGLMDSDPRFVDALRSGKPRPPREYNRIGTLLLIVAALAAFTGIVLSEGHPAAVVALLAVCLAAVVRFVRRRYDKI
jgi:MYXO-CTERM domain-containing protein